MPMGSGTLPQAQTSAEIVHAIRMVRLTAPTQAIRWRRGIGSDAMSDAQRAWCLPRQPNRRRVLSKSLGPRDEVMNVPPTLFNG